MPCHARPLNLTHIPREFVVLCQADGTFVKGGLRSFVKLRWDGETMNFRWRLYLMGE